MCADDIVRRGEILVDLVLARHHEQFAIEGGDTEERSLVLPIAFPEILGRVPHEPNRTVPLLEVPDGNRAIPNGRRFDLADFILAFADGFTSARHARQEMREESARMRVPCGGVPPCPQPLIHCAITMPAISTVAACFTVIVCARSSPTSEDRYAERSRTSWCAS